VSVFLSIDGELVLSVDPVPFGILSTLFEKQTTVNKGAEQAVAVGVKQVSSGVMDHNLSSIVSS
jgi:hypothetical protein